MKLYGDQQDVTHKQPAIGVGFVGNRRRFMCGHSASTTGGLFKRFQGRSAVAWTCAACLAAAAEKATA